MSPSVEGVLPILLYHSFYLFPLPFREGGPGGLPLVDSLFLLLQSLLSFFAHRHFPSKEGGPGGIPLGMQLFLTLQTTKSHLYKSKPLFCPPPIGLSGVSPNPTLSIYILLISILFPWRSRRSLPGHFSLLLTSI